MTDVDPAVAPKIKGTVGGQLTTSEASIIPFAHVGIHDANANASDTLTIKFTGGGALSGAGLSLSNGNYTLRGSAAEITTELDALVFTPTAGAAATQHTTTFTLTDVSSATTKSAIDATTGVTDVDPAVAPTISGTQHGQLTTSEAPLNPFAHVTIADANAGATDTLTIALIGGGALVGAGPMGPDGGYTLTGSASDITAELRALVFTPAAGAPGTQHTTTFNLTDESTATTATATDTTTSVKDVDPAGPLILSVPTSTIELTQAQATSIPGLSLSEAGAPAADLFVVGVHAAYGHLSVVAQTGATTSVNAANVLTIEGSLAGVNATLATLTDTDYHTGDDSIAIAAADTDGLVALPQTIAVHDAGLDLEVSAPASANIPVGVATAIGPISVSETGAAADGVFTVGVTDAHGHLAMTAQGLAQVHVNNAGVLVAKGSLADVNATLKTLTDTDQQGGGDTLQIFAANSYGNHASTIGVAINETYAPTISGAESGQQTISEAPLNPFAQVLITDANSGATDTLTISLTGGGTLAGAGPMGSDGSYKLTGSATDITADLKALVFTPAAGEAGTQHTTTFTLTDSSTGTTATAVDATTTVTDTDPVGPLVLSVPGSTIELTQAQATTVPGFSLTEDGAPANDVFTVNLSDAHGHLAATAGGGATVDGEGSEALTIVGSLADVNATLATLTDTDFHTGNDSIAISASDSIGRSAGPASVAVHDPGLVLTVSAPTSANVKLGAATALGPISLSESVAAADDVFTVSMSDTHGLLSMSQHGLASVFVNGSGALVVEGSLADVNATLQTLTDLDQQAAGDTLTIQVADSYGNHASATGVAISETYAPTISGTVSGQQTISEAPLTPFAQVTVGDANPEAADTLTISLTGGGTLSGKGLVGSDGSYSLTGSAGTVTQNLEALVFTPSAGAAGTQHTTTFTLTDSSTGTTAIAVDATTTVTDTDPVGPLVLSAPGSTIELTQAQATAVPGISLAEGGAPANDVFTVKLSDAHGHLAATAEGGATVDGEGSEALTIVGSLADVNASLATLTDTDFHTGNDAIEISASDSIGRSVGPAHIHVHDSGLDLIVSAPTSANVKLGAASAVGPVSISESGAAADDVFTVSMSDVHGSLSMSQHGSAGVFVNGSGALVVEGSLADVNATLQTLTDTDQQAARDTLTIQVADSYGNHAGPLDVIVSETREAPSIAAPASITVNEGVATAIPGLSIAEAGNDAGESFTVTLNDAHGLLAATASGVASVSGGGSAHLTISGSLADVNATLLTLSDLDSVSGADTLTAQVNDLLGQSSPLASIAISNPALAPMVTATGATAFAAWLSVPTSIPGFVVSEVGAVAGETFQVTLADSDGALSVTLQGGAHETTDSASNLVLSGDLVDLNATLATLEYTRSIAGVDTIQASVSDSFGNIGGVSSVLVGDGGAKPVVAAPPFVSVVRGAATAIPAVQLSEAGAISGETFTVTLTYAPGALAVALQGTAQATGVGSSNLAITGDLADVNASLATLSAVDLSLGKNSLSIQAADLFGGLSNVAVVNTESVAQLHYVWTAGSGTWDASSAGDWNPPGNSTTPSETSIVTIGSGPGGVVTLGNDEFVYSLSLIGGDSLAAAGHALATVGEVSVSSGSALSAAALNIGDDLYVAGTVTIAGVAMMGGGAIVAGVLALDGGTIENTALSGAGIIETTPGQSGTLDNVTIAAGATFIASAGATTNLTGQIVVDGSLALHGGDGQSGYLNLIGPTTLSGSGELVMVQDPAHGGGAQVEGDGETLTIASGMTVQGEGEIGGGGLALVNQGAIIAKPESDTGVLTLDGTGGIVNDGKLEAVDGGHLTVSTALSGSGSLAVGASSELELGVASSEFIVMDGVGAVFKLDDASAYSGILHGFGVGEFLDLSGIDAISAKPTLDGSNTKLTVAMNGGGSLQFSMAGDYTADSLGVMHSGSDSDIYLKGNPVILAPGAGLPGAEGTATILSNVRVAELHTSEGQIFTVEVTDSSGLFSATGAGVSGAGTTSLKIAGSLAQVNAELSTMTFQTNSATADRIAINADDGLGYSAAPVYIAIAGQGGARTPSSDSFVFKSNLSGVAAVPVESSQLSTSGSDLSAVHFTTYQTLAQAAADAGFSDANSLDAHAPGAETTHNSALHEHAFHL